MTLAEKIKDNKEVKGTHGNKKRMSEQKVEEKERAICEEDTNE